VWGAKRALPVRLTGLSITEEAFDPRLNPILARAELNLAVLSYADLSPDHAGHAMFLAHQVAKEAMATLNVVASAQNVGFPLQVP
jgi:hypothetical protein